MTPPRIDLITLGVTDLRRSRPFPIRRGARPGEAAPGILVFDPGRFRPGRFGPGRFGPGDRADGLGRGRAPRGPVPTAGGGDGGPGTDPGSHRREPAQNPARAPDREGWPEPAR